MSVLWNTTKRCGLCTMYRRAVVFYTVVRRSRRPNPWQYIII